MKNVANSRFTITSWDEKPYGEGQDLPKLTRAAVTKSFTGDIAAEGHVEYLMMYRREGGQLCAPTHWSIRERRGDGVLFRHPWLRNRRASWPARRGHVGRRARG